MPAWLLVGTFYGCKTARGTSWLLSCRLWLTWPVTVSESFRPHTEVLNESWMITVCSPQDHHLPVHCLCDWPCGQVGRSHSHCGKHWAAHVSYHELIQSLCTALLAEKEMYSHALACRSITINHPVCVCVLQRSVHVRADTHSFGHRRDQTLRGCVRRRPVWRGARKPLHALFLLSSQSCHS